MNDRATGCADVESRVMKWPEDFLAHFRRQRRWTHSLFAAVPEEDFSWRPESGTFSCGDLLRHLIQAERFWVRLLASAARGEDYDPFGLATLELAARIEAFRRPNLEAAGDKRFGATFAEGLGRWSEQEVLSCSRLAEVPAAALGAPVTHPLSGFTGTFEEMFWVMIEHESHHRGQLSAYLKVLGVAHPADLWS